jgi:hypothetical protein
MTEDIRTIEELVLRELRAIADQPLLEMLRTILVPPEAQRRAWPYLGDPELSCWLVAKIPDTRTGIVYSENGYGPSYGWGVVDLDVLEMGMDGAWHINLEHAFRSCGMWSGRNPPGYEAP